GFHGVVALAHGRVDGIDGNEPDSQVLFEILVGGNVPASALEAHFHLNASAFADRGNVHILVEDFNVSVGLDHAAGHDPRLVYFEIDCLRSFAVQLEGDLFQVEDNIGRIFDHAGNRLKLVQHAFNLDRSDGCALDRGKQHAAQRVADGGAKSALKGLGPEASVFVG